MTLSQLLFETPWWLPTLIAGAGLVLFIYANARREWKLRGLGAGVIGLALLLILVSYVVDTDLEKVRKRTKQFVAAVDQRDWTTFKTLLDPKTTFYFYRNRDDLTSGAQKTADDIGLKSVNLLSLEAEQTDSLITMTLGVISNQDFSPYPIRTNWQFDWQETSEGWVLRTIRPLGGDRIKAEDVQRRLREP